MTSGRRGRRTADDDDESYSRLVFSPLAFLSGLLATFIAGALCLGVCKRVYFIDGMCIDQCDSEKLLGIRSIGGFLSISSQFVALWDEQYFTRLWCVYELAVYRALNPRCPVLSSRFAFARASPSGTSWSCSVPPAWPCGRRAAPSSTGMT